MVERVVERVVVVEIVECKALGTAVLWVERCAVCGGEGEGR